MSRARPAALLCGALASAALFAASVTGLASIDDELETAGGSRGVVPVSYERDRGRDGDCPWRGHEGRPGRVRS
ncbi:MAG: hypothetical protein H0U84_05185 [Thermoleophilaceae bacterium]|nr:hypothetical protein [Thermoleophilaceae bacterium]